MPTRSEAPRSAAEAAHQLARQGRHVHLVSDGHGTCLKGTCATPPLDLPDTVRERARLTRILLAAEERQRGVTGRI
ncbi:hypothetical protein SCAB_48341 [Streptomyces scabiei 87.22]|uniref:Uncharacterized protein n=1 Tax=Streptomyces scabiei (strain 87.22) TaxID=680198 RepID=C9ZF99_STRSW|nr:hypothetical protein [Streptomyces scabiei]MDX2892487.1 hypothetical protein [Streptomyces scabiei]MDX2900580.1 hypothetical protein [Streptomyces scabiei]MDX2994112.1 hypothetical protein [Streptomyces scabiei]MDX3084754.1 hypothetical protein [Streptomyces scabiei]MDX3137882.1 hypothetical protein [Streptomyces scabiei]